VAICGAALGAAPAAQRGVIDLRGMDLSRAVPVQLDGEWRFAPGRFDDPSGAKSAQAATLAVPGAWNAAVGGGEGYGTYRLSVLCDDARELALLLPRVHSAMRAFANGREIAHQGEPGTSAQSTRPAITRQIAALGAQSCPLELVLHVANFHHREGGLVQSPRLGGHERLLLQRERGMSIDQTLIGGFLVMALLTLLFYLGRPRDLTPLWLGLFCLCMVAYFQVSKEQVFERLIAPDAGWEPYLKAQALSFYLATPLLALFLRALYPTGANRYVVHAVLACSLAAAAAVLVLPARLHTYTLPLMQLVTLAAAAWSVAMLVLVSRQRRSPWPLLLVGMALFYPVMVLDLLHTNTVLRFAFAPLGLFAYLVAPAAVLARRFSQALNAEEMRTTEEHERVDLLGRAAKAGLFDWDVAAGRTVYSEYFKAMLGYPRDVDSSRWAFFDFIHPEDLEAVRETFAAQIGDRSQRKATLQHPGRDYRLRRADGGFIWVRSEASSVTDAEGRTLRFITSFIDITPRREQERLLLEHAELARFEQRRLDLVVRAARVGIVDWDGRTHATYYSPRFREIRGYLPDADTSGWPDFFKVLIHPEDRARVAGRFRDFILGTGPAGLQAYIDEDCRISRADGSHVWIQVSGICVRDATGFATRFIAAITDATERRAQEESLRQSVRLREEVERMSRHDLKTPIHSVIAVSRLLRENSQMSPDDAELLGTVERAGYRILDMVNLSLDLFRMESGTYRFSPQTVDLVDVARKAATDVESQASSKNVAVRVRQSGGAASSPTSLLARAEELLCYSMLANLVKNAIEASPEGGTVTITLESAGESVRLHVHNAGAVPEAIRASFFDKYATAGKSAGLGLGTYSAHLLARVQEGDISLDTSEEEGTTISVRLGAASKDDPVPLGAAAREKAERERLPELPAMRVLVVDDDEFNRLVLRHYLPSPPLTVAMAVNGRAALDAALRN
jgi:PAS domain S-box-containing protein